MCAYCAKLARRGRHPLFAGPEAPVGGFKSRQEILRRSVYQARNFACEGCGRDMRVSQTTSAVPITLESLCFDFFFKLLFFTFQDFAMKL